MNDGNDSARAWSDSSGELKRRLAGARNAAYSAKTLSDENDARILRARARDLAREADSAEEQLPSIEIVEFTLAGERYALNTNCVREVCSLVDITPLPGTPEFVLGLVNIRGQIHSVLDIKRFFRLPLAGITDLHQLILIQDDAMVFGILADTVTGISRLALAEIRATPPTLTGIQSRYLMGVTADRIIVLDGQRLLSDPDIVVRDQLPRLPEGH